MAQTITQSITVGPEEVAWGPIGTSIDNPFHTIKIQGGLRGFSSNSSTSTFTGADLNSMQAKGIALQRGTLPNFDHCGSWLNSVYKMSETKWIGWYHAESNCDYSIGLSHQSVAFAESNDSGETWTKPNYPNNQVLTSDTPINNTKNDDVGNQKVIVQGEYFYMLHTCGWDICIARSKVSDLGKPGTWLKFYNGNFTEPGLGGHSTKIPNIGNAHVSYNTYLNKYINMTVNAKWGFKYFLSANQDLTNWTSQGKPFLPEVSLTTDTRSGDWTNRVTGTQVYGYPSIIGLDGNSSESRRSFYLYYMKLYPREDFSQRYLARRKITLGNNPYHLVSLSSPTDIDTQKPSQPLPTLNNNPTSYGYLVSHEYVGLVPVYSCINANSNPFLSITTPLDADNIVWKHCKSLEDLFIRKLGYISKIRGYPFTQSFINPLDNTTLGYIVPPHIIGDINDDSDSEGDEVNIYDYSTLIENYNYEFKQPDITNLIQNFDN